MQKLQFPPQNNQYVPTHPPTHPTIDPNSILYTVVSSEEWKEGEREIVFFSARYAVRSLLSGVR
jgi:hypothetical protein